MKNIFLLIFICITCLNLNAQWHSFETTYTTDYEAFESKGEFKDNKKDGKWIEVNKKGTIYTESYYNEGIPIGIWTINYPNGQIRKLIEYDSLGHIIKWSRFKNNVKQVEVLPIKYFDNRIISLLSNIENEWFDTESAISKSQPKESSAYGSMTIAYKPKYELIINNLKNNGFNGKCLMFYESGNLGSVNIIENGTNPESSIFFYSNGYLKYEDKYFNGELYSTIKYDKMGKILKIKKAK